VALRHLASVAVAVVGGALLGASVHRLHWAALVETITAILSGWVLGSLVAAGAWLLWPPQNIDVLAVSVGLTQALVAATAIAALGVLVHFGFDALGRLRPDILALRPAVPGTLGAIMGLVGFAFGAAVRPLA
jgi:hypothetical protein